MPSIGVTELKAHLAKYLRMVRRGVEVQILDRGVPIARLLGMPDSTDDEHDQVERLVAAGIARRGSGSGSVRAIAKRRLKAKVDLAAALDADREESV
jgi:prevent-host-death family protein